MHYNTGMENCIEWQHACTRAGYGVKRIKDKSLYAHRIAYCEDRGIDIAEIAGQSVMHLCDNPKCINPKHLKLGSHADNMADMGLKGRSKRGEDHHNSKLSKEAVLAIRKAYACGERHPRKLAKKYGVSYYTIMKAAKGALWGWL